MKQHPSPSQAPAEEHSQQQRTRNTVQRRAVLCAIQDLAGTHPTAADVYAHLRPAHPNMSLATVYRALHALVQQRQIGETCIENVTRYDDRPEPHHHALCRGCGAVADVFAPLPPSAVRRLRESSPFVLDTCSVMFTGLCPSCAAAAGRSVVPCGPRLVKMAEPAADESGA